MGWGRRREAGVGAPVLPSFVLLFSRCDESSIMKTNFSGLDSEARAMPDRTNEFAACARVLSNGQLPRAR